MRDLFENMVVLLVFRTGIKDGTRISRNMADFNGFFCFVILRQTDVLRLVGNQSRMLLRGGGLPPARNECRQSQTMRGCAFGSEGVLRREVRLPRPAKGRGAGLAMTLREGMLRADLFPNPASINEK